MMLFCRPLEHQPSIESVSDQQEFISVRRLLCVF